MIALVVQLNHAGLLAHTADEADLEQSVLLGRLHLLLELSLNLADGRLRGTIF